MTRSIRRCPICTARDGEHYPPDDDRAAYGAPPRDELVLARLINGGA